MNLGRLQGTEDTSSVEVPTESASGASFQSMLEEKDPTRPIAAEEEVAEIVEFQPEAALNSLGRSPAGVEISVPLPEQKQFKQLIALQAEDVSEGDATVQVDLEDSKGLIVSTEVDEDLKPAEVHESSSDDDSENSGVPASFVWQFMQTNQAANQHSLSGNVAKPVEGETDQAPSDVSFLSVTAEMQEDSKPQGAVSTYQAEFSTDLELGAQSSIITPEDLDLLATSKDTPSAALRSQAELQQVSPMPEAPSPQGQAEIIGLNTGNLKGAVQSTPVPAHLSEASATVNLEALANGSDAGVELSTAELAKFEVPKTPNTVSAVLGESNQGATAVSPNEALGAIEDAESLPENDEASSLVRYETPRSPEHNAALQLYGAVSGGENSAPTVTTVTVPDVGLEMRETPSLGGLSSVGLSEVETQANPVGTATGMSQNLQTDFSGRFAVQLAEAAKTLPDKPIELTLSPEELGKVKLTFQVSEAGAMHVVIAAERPETLELMKRNADALLQDFRELGYENSNFSFHQENAQDDQRKGSNSEGFQASEGPESVPGITRNESAISQQAVRIALDANASLDMRL